MWISYSKPKQQDNTGRRTAKNCVGSFSLASVENDNILIQKELGCIIGSMRSTFCKNHNRRTSSLDFSPSFITEYLLSGRSQRMTRVSISHHRSPESSTENLVWVRTTLACALRLLTMTIQHCLAIRKNAWMVNQINKYSTIQLFKCSCDVLGDKT